MAGRKSFRKKTHGGSSGSRFNVLREKTPTEEQSVSPTADEAQHSSHPDQTKPASQGNKISQGEENIAPMESKSLRDDSADLRQQMAEVMEVFRKQQGEIVQLKEAVHQQSEKIYTLQEEAKEANERLHTLQEEAKMANEKIHTLEEEAKRANEKIHTLGEEAKRMNAKMDEMDIKLDLTLAATRRLRLLQFLESYPYSPGSLSGRMKHLYMQLCAWKHGPFWAEAVLLVLECDGDAIPPFIPQEDIYLLFKAQFGFNGERLKRKWKALVRAPAIAELFQLHATLVKANIIGFPAVPEGEGHLSAPVRRGSGDGWLYQRLHRKLVEIIDNISADNILIFSEGLISKSYPCSNRRIFYDVARVGFWALMKQKGKESGREERMTKLVWDMASGAGIEWAQSFMSLPDFQENTLGGSRVYSVTEIPGGLR